MENWRISEIFHRILENFGGFGEISIEFRRISKEFSKDFQEFSRFGQARNHSFSLIPIGFNGFGWCGAGGLGLAAAGDRGGHRWRSGTLALKKIIRMRRMEMRPQLKNIWDQRLRNLASLGVSYFPKKIVWHPSWRAPWVSGILGRSRGRPASL